MRRALATLLIVAASGVGAAPPPPNFGTVVENGIYRGGQPSEESLDYLRALGVKTILKLNGWRLEAEQVAADRVGMELVSIPFDSSTVGSPSTCSDVARALAIMADRSYWPVYVHCTCGRDRTGYLVGVYRELVQGWTWEPVDRELAEYGHTGSSRRAYPGISSELERGVRSCRERIADSPVPVSP